MITISELHKALTGSPFKLHYRTTFQGIPISIENRKGSKRQWGEKPEEHTVMTHPYGYVRGSMGYDGDEVDVYIGPDKKSEFVFIVNQRQRRALNKFDEHKVMLGFKTLAAAKKGYLAHFDKIGPKMISSIRMWTVDRFKRWLDRHGAKKGPVRKSLGECGVLAYLEPLAKAGLYIGPRGGKWADAKHTIPWVRTGEVALPEAKIRKLSERFLPGVADTDLVSGSDLKNPKSSPVITVVRNGGGKQKLRVRLDIRTPDSVGMIGFKPAGTGKQVTGASVHIEDGLVKIVVEAGHVMPRVEWGQYIRTALAHELAHAMDPQVKRKSPVKTRSDFPPWEQGYLAYANLPTETRSRLTQMARDLRDTAAAESVSDYTDPLRWAHANATDFAEHARFLDPGNLRKFHQTIAAIWEAHREGKLPKFEKGNVPASLLLGKSLAKGLYIGPRGGKWSDPQHTIPWKEPAAPKGAEDYKGVPPHVIAKLVDSEAVDRSWQAMHDMLVQLDTDLKEWSMSMGDAGGSTRISRKKLSKSLAEIKEKTLAKIPTARAAMVGGLTVETIDSSIEQQAASVVQAAFDWREGALTRRDARTGRFDYTTQEMRDSLTWVGVRRELHDGIRIFNTGGGLAEKRDPEYLDTEMGRLSRDRDEAKAKDNKEWWTKTWRSAIASALHDVSQLPTAHHDLLRKAGVRTRFLVTAASKGRSDSFASAEAGIDQRLKTDLITMYSSAALSAGASDEGTTLVHEVGHIVETLVGRALYDGDEGSWKKSQLRELLADETPSGEGFGPTEGIQAASWSSDRGEWFAEAYRKIYRGGIPMKTTLQRKDFDNDSFQRAVNDRVGAALKSGVQRLKGANEDPIELIKALRLTLAKAGPYVGPKGGLYADPAHKTSWSPDYRNVERNDARIESLGRKLSNAIASGNEGDRKYAASALEEDHGVTVHPEAKGKKPEPKAPLRKVLFHSAPVHSMDSIQDSGLTPRSGSGLFEHGVYAQHSQGKVFLSDNFAAATNWHGKVEDTLETRDESETHKHGAVMLRVKHRRTARDKVGDDDVPGSRQTKKTVPPEHIEYHDENHGWQPLHKWSAGKDSIPGSEEQAHAGRVQKSLLFVPLSKSVKPPAGFSAIPGGKRGGYRKPKGGGEGGWEYWYPQEASVLGKKPVFEWGVSKWTEEQFAAGSYDKFAGHWFGYQKVKGKPPIGWTTGGVVASSKHPVKEAGLPHRLFQIVDANADKGWAKIRDVRTGDVRLVEHSRILPVFHDAKKKPQKTAVTDSPPWSPGERPPAVKSKGTSGKAKKIPAFEESRAKKGTGLAAMEGGVFLRHSERVYESDESGNPVRIERSKTHVDNQTKTKILAEFGPMISRTAREAKKKFGLQPRWAVEPGKRRVDETLAELRMSAIEGVLVAMERYEGGLPFGPLAKIHAKDYARLHAAKEFSGGISIPKMHARLLSKYMAARVQAFNHEGVMDPGPELVAKYWDIKKRDLHGGMDVDDPQRSEGVPMKSYKLKVKVRIGGKKETGATDTKHQPGKVEWAERMHSFLTGQATAQGSEFFADSSLVFPGVHIGAGLSARDKVEIRQSIGKILPKLREHEITIQTGRQSSTYKADSGAILVLRLGLDGSEGMSAEHIAAEVSIQKQFKDGWRDLGHRQKRTLVQTFLERALDRVRNDMGEGRGKILVGRAKERVAPEEHVRPGITWRQELKRRAREVSTARVQDWRKKERDRLRRIRVKMLGRARVMKQGSRREHQEQLAQGVTQALRRIDRMGNREVALRVAQSELGRMTKQTRAMQLASVEVEGSTAGYDYGRSVVTMTDPHTGRQRRVQMRTMKKQPGTPAGQPLRKGEEPLSTGVVRDMLRWPRLTALLYGQESISTVERFALETMVGLH